MSQPYLQVTYHRGKPIAAYFYLPRRPGQKSARTQRVEPGLVIDFTKGGVPIGIEITAPSATSLSALNRVLAELGQPKLTRADYAPLSQAA